MNSLEWLFNELWEAPKDKLTWYYILKQAKEMEMISNEEIDQAAPMGNLTLEEGFIRGAKWYREQLKQRQ
jgi:hypothetical protein